MSFFYMPFLARITPNGENINNCRELPKRICLSRTNRHVEWGKRSNTRNIQTEYLRWPIADRDVPALNQFENPENNSLYHSKESFGNARGIACVRLL